MEQAKLHDLLQSLTLQEKIGQLIQLSGEFFDATDISLGPQRKLGITQEAVDLAGSVLNVAGAKEVKRIQDNHLRQGGHPIPLLFMADVIYGYKTVYPIPLGIGATWDPALVERAYTNTADEARASGLQVSFAPMVDLVRDPRWGRVLESTGEDPYLNSRFAAAMVKGFQKNLAAGSGLVSCVKHFAAYGAAEAGREYNPADLSTPTLFQDYLPSYKAAIDAGVKMVMTSLTTLNGVPATADKWLLQDILRKRWGFDGVIISDYASVYELIKHGFAQDSTDAAANALTAGVDIDMKSPCYANGLQPLVENGHLSEAKIDDAVWRVLTLKNELGLFEHPYGGATEEREHAQTLTPEKRSLARDLSRKALVLLKNNENLLPLNPHGNQRVALIGPYADEQELLGLWAVHGERKDTVTIKAGFLEYLPAQQLQTAKGTDIIRDRAMLEKMGVSAEQIGHIISGSNTEQSNHDQALAIAKNADIIVFAAGEHTLQSGEAGSRTRLRLPDNQRQLLAELRKLNKPIVLIVISGRPLVLTDVQDQADAILQAWFPGTEGGHAIADVIFGRYNPTGRLSMTFPYDEGQLPLYYNHLSTGRPENHSQHSGRFVSRYIDNPNKPLYPFGYGLSYGSVQYDELKLDSDTLAAAGRDELTAAISVTNTGTVPREETVQFYIHDQVASIVQPVKRLIGFQKVPVQPGETKTAALTITPDMLSFANRDGEFITEPGMFDLFAGPNSQDVHQTSFSLTE